MNKSASNGQNFHWRRFSIKRQYGLVLAGLCAGAVNGLFGAGGGMVLVPMLVLLTDVEDDRIFSSSLAVILPICLVSLSMTAFLGGIAWGQAFPYLIGSTAGGVLAGLFGRKLPVKWLHRALAVFILWGGIRYLC